MAASIVSLQEVVVQYGPVPVLSVPALHVHAGDTLAIIGPNGAGKSTLLRVMGLLQAPTRGQVHVHGQVAKRGRRLALRRRMASVMQEPLLIQGSVFDNAALGLKLRRLDRGTIAQRVDYWLHRLGIAHLQQRSVQSLSGGEAQRTSLVRALALEPMLLLLDEPFAALDPPSREGLLLDLVDILREANMTTVFVTHDRHEALSLGNRIGILVNGEVVQIGRPWDVFRQPATAAVARLVGAEVMLGGAVVSSTPPYSQVATAVGTIVAAATLPVGTRVTLCLRPEDLTVQPHDPPPHVPSAHNVVLGTLTRVIPWGGQLRVTVDCGIPLTALLPGYCTNALGRQRGQPVAVCFAASAVHVIPSS